MLGLPEVPRLRTHLHDELNARAHGELVKIINESATRIRGYLGTTLATSVLTGIASALLSFVLGLDPALVWGLLTSCSISSP